MCGRYDERTELADYADIRAVPSFQFYMDGKLVEQFATRDKAKISLAIDKYVANNNANVLNFPCLD